MKAQAAAQRGPLTVEPVGTAPELPSAPGRETPGATINFNGDNQSEVACQDVTPGDQALAIGDGSNPILQAVNLCLSVWSPAGARLAGPVTLQSFFGLPSSTFVSDPRALYDWYNHRFIVIMLDTDFASSNNYDIAVSLSDDPTAGYCTYRIPVVFTSNALPDFPRLGQDHTATYPGFATSYPGAIYIASNLFSNTTGSFLYEDWLVIGKSFLYNCAGGSYWVFNNLHNPDGSLAFTSQPANVWSPYEIPRAEFFLESYWNGGNKLVAWAVSNPFGFVSGGPSPELSAVQFNTVNAYTFPPNASQPGAANSIDTNDARISGEVTYNSGYVHGALTSGNSSGATNVAVYKVRPILNRNDDTHCPSSGSFFDACPQITAASIADESILSYGSNFAYYGTPQPDVEGNVTTVFNFSGPSCSVCYAGLAYISQRVTAGSSFVDSGSFLQQGLAFYNQGRWGDYTAVAPAGVAYVSNGNIGKPGMGFSGMYANSGSCFGAGSGCWYTKFGFNRFAAPTQP
jgi:hypothetical protein